MTLRRPTVLVSGVWKELPAGDGTPGAQFFQNTAASPPTGTFAPGDRWWDDAGALFTWTLDSGGVGAWTQIDAPIDIAATIHAATGKTTPVDADELGIVDSAASNVLAKLTFANLATWVGVKLGLLTFAATGKTTPVDGDSLPISDSAASNATKKVTFANLALWIGAKLKPITSTDKGTGAASSTQTFDFPPVGAPVQKLTIGGALTIALANLPTTGFYAELLLQLVNGNAFLITWPTGGNVINWVKADGTTTTSFATYGVTLQTSGTDWVMVWCNGDGVVWGKVMR